MTDYNSIRVECHQYDCVKNVIKKDSEYPNVLYATCKEPCITITYKNRCIDYKSKTPNGKCDSHEWFEAKEGVICILCGMKKEMDY